MALKIYWSNSADEKFEQIIAYLNKNWGEKVTSNFVNNVFDFLEILKKFPKIGSIEYEEKNIRGFVIVKQVTLFYRIHNNKIILLDFFDNRSNPKNKKF